MEFKDFTEGRLREEVSYARKIKDFSLIQCLKRVKQIAKNTNSEANIFTDFAPHSFEFAVKEKTGRLVLNGGIIFHGKHDGFGSGSAPTFSVSLTPTKGWSIHT